MLAQMTPRQFDEWRAAYAVGIDDSWFQFAQLAALIVDLFRWLASCIPGMPPWKADDFSEPEDFLPYSMTGKVPEPKTKQLEPMSYEESLKVAKTMEAAFGSRQ